jgi:ABC-type transport system involved in cytochrome c biogenesis permease subunit
MGIFLLPLVEGMIGVAYLLRNSPPFERGEARQYWGLLHGGTLLLGTVAVALGFMAGVMYLVQSYRLKHKLPPRQGFKLPSLEWLQGFNERSLVLSSILLLAGIASGAIFRIVKQDSALAWGDPVVLISAALGGWLIAALLFNLLYRPARQGRKVAYLTVASFVVVMLVMSIVWSSSSHAGRKDSPAIDNRPQDAAQEGAQS